MAAAACPWPTRRGSLPPACFPEAQTCPRTLTSLRALLSGLRLTSSPTSLPGWTERACLLLTGTGFPGEGHSSRERRRTSLGGCLLGQHP